jgi:DNA helicase HerA-like ATPase
MTKNNKDTFLQLIREGYTFKGDSIPLGAAMLNGETLTGTIVSAPLATFNRHGLVAGATGTGKTKALQRFAEGLSKHGVPVLMMDIKGDVSGIAEKGEVSDKTTDRQQKIGIDWTPEAFPVEFLTLAGKSGISMRATVSEFGPVLFSRILDLNDIQEGVVSLVFKYCDDKGLPLLDLKDFKKVLQFLTNEGKEEIEHDYGQISSASTGTIMRKVLELEQQDAEVFFGERSFDVEDLLRTDSFGKGYISILRLMDMQARPKLFSTFMLSLLAEIYQKFPEEGDMDKPKLVVFIDEAHLIFNDASRELLSQIEMTIKLIRSKGVGIFFCTQNPIDVPDEILAQLGMKVQHALRAFTAKDREAIKKAAENYPETEYYDIADNLTQLGIGEAFVTVLNEKGIPTPLVQVMGTTPQSRMDTITDAELNAIIDRSTLAAKYSEVVDRESAYEMLSKKLAPAYGVNTNSSGTVSGGGSVGGVISVLGGIANSPIAKQVARTAASTITRSLLGAIMKGMKS